jgi:hypothetical protein
MEELVKIFPNLTIITIILLFVTIVLSIFTDIPRFVITAVINLIKSNADEPSVPSSKIPTAFWKIPIIAIIEWNFKKDRIQNSLKYSIATIKSDLSSILKKRAFGNINKYTFEKEINSFEYFNGRENISIGKNFITILQGLPGTGKSTFVINFLESLVNLNEIDYIIYIKFRDFRKNYKSIENITEFSEELFWSDICFSNINSQLENSRPTDNLLSYLLNYKSCYIFIDNVNDYEHLNHLINLIEVYFKKFHKKNKKRKIIVSTRFPDLKHFQNLHNVEISILEPLTVESTRKFFYKKCVELEINWQTRDFYDIVDPETSLLRFENEYTQNPLFVQIVCFIIKKNGFANLKEIFQESVTNIYRVFIETLFVACYAESSYEKFYESYRYLAYLVSQKNIEKFESGIIQTAFGNDSLFTSDFLFTNGLLIKKNISGKSYYSFVHQTVQDVLFIDYIVSNNFYDNLSVIGDEFIYYLREQIKNTSEFLELLSVKIDIAQRVITNGFIEKMGANKYKGNSYIFCQNIIDKILEVYIFINSENVSMDSIKRIFNKLKNYISTENIVLYIYDKMKSQTSISYSGLNLLLALRRPILNELVLNCLQKNNFTNELLYLLEKENKDAIYFVNSFLENSDKVNEEKNKNFLMTLISNARILEKTPFIKIWFVNNISVFNANTLDFLLRNRYIRERILYPNYINQNFDDTYKVSKCLSKIIFGKIYLPKGRYEIEKGKVLVNKKSILIPSIPDKIFMKAKSTYDAEMKALESLDKTLMDFEQLEIAYAFFAKKNSLDLLGLVGLNDINIKREFILYEAYKINNKSVLLFAYLENSDAKNNKSIAVNSNSKNFAENIIYRNITILE